MNRWEQELINSILSHNEQKAIQIFTYGFPVNQMLRVLGPDKLSRMTHPLSLAIECGQLKLAHWLIDSGASPNSQDSNGRTPLISAVKSGILSLVELLLENKANPSIRDFEGQTLLHIAAREGWLEIVEFLVETTGIPLKVKNEKGQTPLKQARNTQESVTSLESIEKLQKTIEYLWEKEQKQNRASSVKIPILPPTLTERQSSKIRSIDEYLKTKHANIFNALKYKRKQPLNNLSALTTWSNSSPHARRRSPFI